MLLFKRKSINLNRKWLTAEGSKALKLSQRELATLLDVKQPAISRLEQRTDMYVSHLRQVIEAMGGQLDIVARFPSGDVSLTNFQSLSTSTPTVDSATEIS